MVASEFNPNLFNPFYYARKSLLVEIEALSSKISGKILDVGCGSKPYKELFKYTEYIGVDVNQEGHDHVNEEIDIYYDGQILPIEDESFDSVITSQVFEHVFTPDLFLGEINRVLKVGGKLLLTVPFVWDEHEQPYDFARYSSFGLKHCLEKHGFEIIEHRKTLADFRIIMQLLNAYIFKLSRSNKWILRAVKIFIIMPLNLLTALMYRVLPANKDLYLDNVVLAQKMK